MQTSEQEINELIKTLEQYRTIFENSGASIAVIENNTMISKVNDNFAKLIGYSKDELEGKKRFIELFLIEERSKIMNYHRLRRVDSDSAPNSYKNCIIHKNGSLLNVHITASLIPGTKKSIITMIHSMDQKKIEDFKRLKEEERYLNFHDIMTGLFNRPYFEEELKRLDTKRQVPLSIIIIKIDKLGVVYDNFGQQIGDNLVIKTARVIKMLFRAEDIVCRWEEDMFAIPLPQCDYDSVIKIGNRIIKAAAHEKIEWESTPVNLSLLYATKQRFEQDVGDILRELEYKFRN